MSDKRKYPRYSCKIKAEMEIYESNPDEKDAENTVPVIGKGFILDISRGGFFLISNERVSVKAIIKAKYKIKKTETNSIGKVVRTGLLANNPSELAQKFAQFSSHGDSYIAVELKEPMYDLCEEDI
jgi:hypothetical protein